MELANDATSTPESRFFDFLCNMHELGEAHAIVGVAAHVEVERIAPFHEHLSQVLGKATVEIVAAEEVVAVDGEHLVFAVDGAQDGHVERAAAEIVHEKMRALGELGRPPHMVDRSRGGLLQDAEHANPGELGGTASRLDLRRVEVRRHGDDGVDELGPPFAGLLLQELLHPRLQLAQDLRRDFFGQHRMRAHFDGLARAHLALDRLDGRHRMRAPHARRIADDELLFLLVPCECRGDRLAAEAIGIQPDGPLRRRHHGDLGIGGAEVDADGAAKMQGHGSTTWARSAKRASFRSM